MSTIKFKIGVDVTGALTEAIRDAYREIEEVLIEATKRGWLPS
jgi:hypothetical protein